MAINLVEIAKNSFTEPVTRKISGLLGTSEATTRAGIDVAVPAVVAGLAKQASTPTGATVVSASLDQVEARQPESFAASVDGPGFESHVQAGSVLARTVLGPNFGAVTDGIQRASGMGRGAVHSLLGLVTPVVLSTVAKQRKAQSLDTPGLVRMLGDQKRYLAGALPAGIGEVLGFGVPAGTGRPYEAVPEPVGTVRTATPSVPGERRRSPARPLVTLLVVAALAFLGWRMFAGRDRDETARAGGAREGAAREAAAPADTAVSEVRGVFNDASTVLSSVRDQATAQAALPKIDAISKEVSTLSTRVQSMPQSARQGVGEVVRNTLPNLRAQADRVLDLPGVGDVLSPAVKRLIDGLDALQR